MLDSVLQHLPPKCCNYRHALPHGVYVVLRRHVLTSHTELHPQTCLRACLPSFLRSCVCSIFFHVCAVSSFFLTYFDFVSCVCVCLMRACVCMCVPMKYMKHWTFVVRRELAEVGSLPPPLVPRDWTQVTRFGGSCLPAEPSHWSWTNYLNWS